MRISTNQRRSLLRSAWNAAQLVSLPLRTKLESLSVSSADSFSSGRTIASTAGNGHSVSFSTPGAAVISPPDTAEVYEELIVLFDQIVADSPNLTDDESIFAEMIARLVPAYSSHNDYTNCRF